MTNTKFEGYYQSLNTQQKKAVDRIYGPVMVIAGPGTGKTQLLTTRVGNILRQTDYRPNNILCLTFSNAGVAAMKQRMIEMMGADGNDVEIYTYHSFAEKILQRYYAINELEEYQFIDDLDKQILIRELLEKLDFNTPLKKGINSIDNAIYFLKTFFNSIKSEKYNPDTLLQEYENEKITQRESPEFYYKKSGKNFKAGDFKEKDWEVFENKIDKHIQAVQLYKEYEEIIQSKNLVDYYDSILKAIALLNENENLRLDVQEQYQFIMLDEFQDTNGAQLDLVHQLCMDNDEPNIMVVGDEDQSIYKFQGANLYNIFDFYHTYLAHLPFESQLEHIVVLNENYRSTPIILEASQLLICNNTERITGLIEGHKIAKSLKASHPIFKDISTPIELIESDTKEDEFISLALEIEKLVKSNIDYQDIAVLFQKNGDATLFSNYLNALNYPYELSKEENLLEDKLILSYFELFEIIIYYYENKTISREMISTFILQPWLQLSLLDISKFWVEYKEEMQTTEINFIEFISTKSHVESVKIVFSILDKCIKAYSMMPPERYFHFVLDSFGIKKWAFIQENRLDILQKIETLNQVLLDEMSKHENYTLSDFIKRIQIYIQEKFPIAYTQYIQSDNSIRLMTYHKSKGLEYDYVFVHGCGRMTKSNSASIYIPESIIHKNTDLEEKNSEEEKRRLLYVAMTRAKKKLYLTDLKIKSDKSNAKNKFKEELNPISEKDFQDTSHIGALIIRRAYKMNEQDYLRFSAIQQTDLRVKEEQFIENDFIEKRIKNFELSHSLMNTYLECPQKFYVEKILGIPNETSLAMAIGSFYHSVLELFFKQIAKDASKNQLEYLQSIARHELNLYRNFMSDMEFSNILKSLESNLPILYSQYISTLSNTNYELENNYLVNINHVVVIGKIDKLDIVSDGMRIIDYKTGKYSNAKKNKKFLEFGIPDNNQDGISTDEVYGGNYWRQAVLYQILAKEKYPNLKLDGVEFVFIIPENNKIEVQKVYPTAEAEEYVKQLISDIHNSIMKKEFPNCNKPDCSWCSNLDYRQAYLNF